jgi:hypothetical protein
LCRGTGGIRVTNNEQRARLIWYYVQLNAGKQAAVKRVWKSHKRKLGVTQDLFVLCLFRCSILRGYIKLVAIVGITFITVLHHPAITAFVHFQATAKAATQITLGDGRAIRDVGWRYGAVMSIASIVISGLVQQPLPHLEHGRKLAPTIVALFTLRI